jgi:hypothetical protein
MGARAGFGAIGVLTVALASFGLAATTPRPRTWCNPIDLDYRYNFEQINEGISYRQAADPVILNHGVSTTSSQRSREAIGGRRIWLAGSS